MSQQVPDFEEFEEPHLRARRRYFRNHPGMVSARKDEGDEPPREGMRFALLFGIMLGMVIAVLAFVLLGRMGEDPGPNAAAQDASDEDAEATRLASAGLSLAGGADDSAGADPDSGLTAKDLLARPDLDAFGEPDGQGLSPETIALISADLLRASDPDEMSGDAAVLAANGDIVPILAQPTDPDAGYDESALRATLPDPAAGADAIGAGLPGWYEGAAGYTRAFQERQQRDRPMVVYFRTEWCGYCARFDRDFISSTGMRGLLYDALRVEVNPEAGQEEMALARLHGVTGYPSFFVLPEGETKGKRVHPFQSGSVQGVDDFTAAVKSALNQP